MKKGNSMKKRAAIICAYHPAEDDLAETNQSAQRSAGRDAQFYAVEDKTLSGPGFNRHRGIVAAEGADVIVIIDAHMRFQGDALKRIISAARESGSLLVPFCHHNEQTSFSANKGHYYAGGRIVYRARDGREHKPLDAKWARSDEPGRRGCVMGACYAFRRDWYMGVAGQPLSILLGWGCDEQALSMAAWMTGRKIEVIGEHVAHRYRERAPWPFDAHKECRRVDQNRAALVYCFASHAGDRRDLLSWGNLADPGPDNGPRDRLRLAMLAAPKSWRQWREQVCEPDELDGRQTAPAPSEEKPVRICSERIVVPVHGISCPNCRKVYDPRKLPPQVHQYPNGRTSHRCDGCRNMFMAAPVPAENNVSC